MYFRPFLRVFAAEQLKSEEYEAFYGFTDLRGKPARRGRDSHRTANQVTAGKAENGKNGIFEIGEFGRSNALRLMG